MGEGGEGIHQKTFFKTVYNGDIVPLSDLNFKIPYKMDDIFSILEKRKMKLRDIKCHY